MDLSVPAKSPLMRQRSARFLAVAMIVLLGLFATGCGPARPPIPSAANTVTPLTPVAIGGAADQPTPAVKSGMTAVQPTASTPKPSTLASATSRPGIVTVLTLTPAPDGPTSTVQMKDILTATLVAPASVPAQSPAMAQMMADMQDLYRIMQATRIIMQVLMQGQPTNDEIAAMRAQMNVLSQRMATLMTQTAQLQVTTTATGASVSPPASQVVPLGTSAASVVPTLAQMRNLMALQQQTMGMLQGVITDPTVDDATLAQVQTILGQLQGILSQEQNWLGQTLGDQRSPDVLVPTPKPTFTPMPPSLSGARPGIGSQTRASDDQMNQAQVMMRQLAQKMGQLQARIQQMQNQARAGGASGMNSAPSGGQGAMSGMSAPPSAATSQSNGGASSASGTANTAGQSQDMMSMMSSMMSMMQGMMGGGSGGSMSGGNTGAQTDATGAANSNNPLARRTQAGNVTVTVLPKNLRTPGLASLDFYITLETHAVDLSQDLAQLATLRLPSGAEVPAARWIGPRGGHHVEGTLSFPALDVTGAPLVPPSGMVTLVIRNLAGIGERTFSWDLGQVP